MPSISNLKVWKNGEVFNARDYVYERNLIISQLNRVTALIGDSTSSTTVDLSVNSLTANSMTMNGRTITDFADAGNKTFLSDTTPSDWRDGDLWFDTSEYGE